MKERNCRVGDGNNWYTNSGPEEQVIKELAERLKKEGRAIIPKLKFYWMGPTEYLPDEMKNRILTAAMKSANLS